MRLLAHIIDWLFWASIVAELLLLIRLFQLRIADRNRWLAFWLFFQASSSLILARLHHQSGRYSELWTPITLCGALLDFTIVWEIFSRRAAFYGGVRALGRGLLLLALTTGVLVSLFFVSAEWKHLSWSNALHIPLIFVRTVDTALALFMILAGVIFRLFQEKRASWNVTATFTTLIGYFIGTSVGFLTGNLTGKIAYGWVNLWFQIVNLATMTTLLVLVRRTGEIERKPPMADPGESARLEHLDAQLSHFLGSLKFSWRGLE